MYDAGRNYFNYYILTGEIPAANRNTADISRSNSRVANNNEK
jgi:hypothetical protein